MPGLDGPATFARLRAGPLPSDVPVICLTAKTTTADREALHALGATGVISKPFDPMTLPHQIEQILAERFQAPV
jgi:CheY-like chemotaxis protein